MGRRGGVGGFVFEDRIPDSSLRCPDISTFTLGYLALSRNENTWWYRERVGDGLLLESGMGRVESGFTGEISETPIRLARS